MFSSARLAQETLKAHIQVKSEPGALEAVRPETGGSSQNPGTFAHSYLFRAIHVYSLEHIPSPKNDLALN